jgi:hypothetical protein
MRRPPVSVHGLKRTQEGCQKPSVERSPVWHLKRVAQWYCHIGLGLGFLPWLAS